MPQETAGSSGSSGPPQSVSAGLLAGPRVSNRIAAVPSRNPELAPECPPDRVLTCQR